MPRRTRISPQQSSGSPVYRAGLGCTPVNTALCRELWKLHAKVFWRRRCCAMSCQAPLPHATLVPTANHMSLQVLLLQQQSTSNYSSYATRNSLACGAARPEGHAIVTTHTIGSLPKRRTIVPPDSRLLMVVVLTSPPILFWPQRRR